MTYKLPSFVNGLLIVLAVATLGYFSGSRGAGMLRRALGQQPGTPGNEAGLNEVRPFSRAGEGSSQPPLNSPPPVPQAEPPANLPPPGAATADGNEIVAQAARRVQAEPSVQAQIRFRIDLAGQNLLGNGVYLQLGDGPEKLLRFDLKLQVAQRVAALQQISGQQYYWIRRDLPPANHKVSRVNLRAIRNAITKKHLASDKDSDLSGSLASPADDAWLLLGGLPALLESLHQDFEFGPARAGEIAFPGSAEAGSPARLPVWAVSGTWKKERWEALNAVAAKNKKAVPTTLPQRVDLVLGRSERTFALFPYRVIYYARAEQGGAGEGAANLTPIVSMEFFNVQSAAALDPRDFDYNPGEQEVEDLTAMYLQKLGLVK
jgi:hypothetical protein